MLTDLPFGMTREIEPRNVGRGQYGRLLALYCDVLEKELGHRWRVVAWSQESRINEDGDVRQRLAVTIEADCDRMVFLSFTNRVNWDWPDLRHLVTVDVRTPEVHGIGGTRLVTTDHWIRVGMVKTFVHLDSPLVRGEQFTFLVDVFWPEMCLPFARGHEPDVFLVSFGEVAELISYTVVLPAEFTAKLDHVGLDPRRDSYALVMRSGADGTVEVSLTVRDVPAYRKVGLRIDRPALGA
ncbi:hypothetical protein GCM10010492_25700 [Saccharothrix mutabilis subsp. mutabilis]|uniref:Uncharacterized protein n=1 Tax=Saccharothrix mutabilis subsp. mutabilis TaxID=66855 RepID=A0ABP3D8S1_9PSEU